MVLHLAERLEVPLRERNELLLAAGHAPRYTARSLEDPEMWPIRDAVARLLAGHEPFPALAVDAGWTMVASNGALGPLLEGVAEDLLAPPVNAIRLALHPDGLAPRVRNLGQWRAHLVDRLERQVRLTGDERVIDLLAELESYPSASATGTPAPAAIMVLLELTSSAGDLRFFSTVTTFGTPIDVTLSELSVEAFFPADAATAGACAASAAVSG